MKNTILIKFVISLTLIFSCISNVMAWHGPKSEAEKVYIRQALLGDLSNIQAIISGLDGAEKVIKKFNLKFTDNQHGIALEEIKEPLVKNIMKLYINYWQQALLAPAKLDQLEKQLTDDMVKLVSESKKLKGKYDFESMQEPLISYIKSKGYGVLFGRTPPLSEFMLWKKNEDHDFKVELTDSTQSVRVTYIGDFVSNGWSYYATNGAASTGGWATNEQLYCVCEHYVKTSEMFLLSYLKHEGRHFADFKSYPNLKSASLEYRAKLTELSFADNSSHGLLNKFDYAAVKNTKVGHSLANWHVVNNMKKELGWAEKNENEIEWGSATVKQIQSAAQQLLKKSDQEILKQGADKTENIIFPITS